MYKYQLKHSDRKMKVLSLIGLFSSVKCYSYLPVAYGLMYFDDHFYKVQTDPFKEKIQRLLKLAEELHALDDNKVQNLKYYISHQKFTKL